MPSLENHGLKHALNLIGGHVAHDSAFGVRGTRALFAAFGLYCEVMGSKNEPILETASPYAGLERIPAKEELLSAKSFYQKKNPSKQIKK